MAAGYYGILVESTCNESYVTLTNSIKTPQKKALPFLPFPYVHRQSVRYDKMSAITSPHVLCKRWWVSPEATNYRKCVSYFGNVTRSSLGIVGMNLISQLNICTTIFLVSCCRYVLRTGLLRDFSKVDGSAKVFHSDNMRFLNKYLLGVPLGVRFALLGVEVTEMRNSFR